MVKKNPIIYKKISDITTTEIEAHQGLVKEIAIKCYRFVKDPAVGLDDLISEGNIALLRACQRFNPTNKIQFSTFAYLIISESLRAYVNRSCQPIRFPNYMVEISNKILSLDLLNAPDEEVSQQLSQSIARIKRAKECIRLRFPTRFEQGVTVTNIEPSSESQYFVKFECSLSHYHINKVMEYLSDRDQKIFTLYASGVKVRSISETFGLTLERIRQIIKKSKNTLKQYIDRSGEDVEYSV